MHGISVSRFYVGGKLNKGGQAMYKRKSKEQEGLRNKKDKTFFRR